MSKKTANIQRNKYSSFREKRKNTHVRVVAKADEDDAVEIRASAAQRRFSFQSEPIATEAKANVRKPPGNFSKRRSRSLSPVMKELRQVLAHKFSTLSYNNIHRTNADETEAERSVQRCLTTASVSAQQRPSITRHNQPFGLLPQITKEGPNDRTKLLLPATALITRLFKRRPPRETLVRQGIYKNEPIFGNTLERLYEASERAQPVPAFVQRCTQLLGAAPHVRSVGLYRTSGNLSHIQRLRCRVDQEDAGALDDVAIAADSDVLAGALKLFFRELLVPLVPHPVYMRLSRACELPDDQQRLQAARSALAALPVPHRRTLSTLCMHLCHVTAYESFNQMSAANLAIVWGPSFTWPDLDAEAHSSADARALYQCTDVNRVVQYLIEASPHGLFQ